jgi:hypothetical protein
MLTGKLSSLVVTTTKYYANFMKRSKRKAKRKALMKATKHVGKLVISRKTAFHSQKLNAKSVGLILGIIEQYHFLQYRVLWLTNGTLAIRSTLDVTDVAVSNELISDIIVWSN